MSTVLLMTVGGSLEPLIKSLCEHQPTEALFFASNESVEHLGQLKKEAQTHGLTFTSRNLVVSDAEDLTHCYRKGLSADRMLKEYQTAGADIIIDYTGGTKSMVAGLMLATAGSGFDYAYVGGRERTKEGTGIVISGAENLRPMEDPLILFAVDQKKRLSLLIERYQFTAARQVASSLSEQVSDREKLLFKHILGILEGYIAWECFDHKAACKHLYAGVDKLKEYNALANDESLALYSRSIEENIRVLNQIQKETNGFKKGILCRALVVDLLGNAQRRAEEGKYDDAVGRLYRTLEMVGQIAFQEEFHCATSDVQIEKLPESIRQRYQDKYREDENSPIKVPAMATYAALAEAGHKLGLQFRSAEKQLRNVLNARNESILAHGTRVLGKKEYTRLYEYIASFVGDVQPVVFPKLPWHL